MLVGVKVTVEVAVAVEVAVDVEVGVDVEVDVGVAVIVGGRVLVGLGVLFTGVGQVIGFPAESKQVAWAPAFDVGMRNRQSIPILNRINEICIFIALPQKLFLNFFFGHGQHGSR